MSSIKQSSDIKALQGEITFLKERVTHLEASMDNLLQVVETLTSEKATIKPQSAPKKTVKAH